MFSVEHLYQVLVHGCLDTKHCEEGMIISHVTSRKIEPLAYLWKWWSWALQLLQVY